MYCPNCNEKISDNAKNCPQCGIDIDDFKPSVSLSDKGGIMWGMLGFFLPCLISIIVYFIVRDTKPKNAQVFLMGIVLNVVSSIILIFYSCIFFFFLQ